MYESEVKGYDAVTSLQGTFFPRLVLEAETASPDHPTCSGVLVEYILWDTYR
jgi:hypothetical protein